jgi:hypothetical protein
MNTDAGSVEPDLRRWRVTETHGHITLGHGDEVVVVESPTVGGNYLLRMTDLTLHHLRGDADQYVHLTDSRENDRDE